MELRFRPDDIFCKPTCGDRHNTNGFLLRIRIKKSRVKKAEETEAKQQRKSLRSTVNVNESSIDDNKNTENSVDKVNLPQTRDNKGQQEQLMTELIDQVQSCSFSTLDNPVPGPSHRVYSENNEVLLDQSLDTNEVNSSKNKKDIPPTFDRNKYEDLSEDKDYTLPKLQILGRVDTEFRFTSMYGLKWIKSNLCNFFHILEIQLKNIIFFRSL